MRRASRVGFLLLALVIIGGSVTWLPAGVRMDCVDPEAGCPNWAGCEGDLAWMSGCSIQCYWQVGTYVYPGSSAFCGGNANPHDPKHQTP